MGAGDHVDRARAFGAEGGALPKPPPAQQAERQQDEQPGDPGGVEMGPGPGRVAEGGGVEAADDPEGQMRPDQHQGDQLHGVERARRRQEAGSEPRALDQGLVDAVDRALHRQGVEGGHGQRQRAAEE
jgi:hypothetical protein